ncbi:MAG: holo-ACP synthase [Sedimentisphaerales bacterium]|nr:holo-ACP synthase [Sedimentisphaerales bacterium]
MKQYKRYISQGIDLVEVVRIEQMLARHSWEGLSRIFTQAERDYARQYKKNPSERLAGRYAVKEAVLKLLGTGLRDGLEMIDIETTNDSLGKPIASLTGKTAQQAAEMGITHLDVSITHCAGLAIASVIGFALEEQ